MKGYFLAGAARRRPLAGLVLTTAALPLIAATGSSASAAPVVERPRLSGVDVSGYPQVSVTVAVPSALAPELPARAFRVGQGGVTVPTGQVRRLAGADLAVALVLDPGLGGARLGVEQTAAVELLLALPGGSRTVVVEGGMRPRALTPLTADTAVAIAGVAHLHPGIAASVPAGLRLAADLLQPAAQARRAMVVFNGSGGGGEARPFDALRSRLVGERVAVYPVEFGSYAPAGEGLDRLAAATGGITSPRVGPDRLGQAGHRIATDLAGHYRVTFVARGVRADTVLLQIDKGRDVYRLELPVPGAMVPSPGQSIALGAPSPSRRHSRAPTSLWLWLSTTLVVFGVSYSLGMLLLSRRDRRVSGTSVSDLFFVFLLPCLNEERVIQASLDRLLAVPGTHYRVLVIDDASDDRTGELVTAYSARDQRVWLLRRTPPAARLGKGEALNAAIRFLLEPGRLASRRLDRVIVVVVDADGRMDPWAVTAVTPYFADPAMGGVQIGVRINNRHLSLLARMQDMEFVIYTDVFQRGRRHIGSVGLGGNGQFMRLSALLSLGLVPWSRSLTEDLDLGVRLLTHRWRNDYCPTVAVHQQGVVNPRLLVRQRSRWFQGHLQSWKLIPEVLRDAPVRAMHDLLYHLSSPALILLTSFLSLSFLLSISSSLIAEISGESALALGWLLDSYLLSFGPAILYGLVYWRRERHSGLGPVHAVLLAHLYVGYGLMWFLAGWWAVGRVLRGRNSWAKTDRTAEPPQASGQGGVVPFPHPPAPAPATLAGHPPAPTDAPRPHAVEPTTDRPSS